MRGGLPSISRRVATMLSVFVMTACAQGNEDTREPGPTPTTNPPPVAEGKPTAEVVIETPSGDAVARVEVVRNQRDIRRGLMYRRHLPDDAGMLFLFGKEKIQSFWMKNTLISLDMVFIRADMTVAGVVANTIPQDKTSRFVNTPSQFVLEVNAGWAARHGVVAGARVRFVKVDDVPPGVPLGG